MSEAYLTHPKMEGIEAKVFDIHGGGLDLIFPHHENELAQSRCCHGTDAMANVWMHNEFLRVEGEKMSKSLGNFHTVHDVLDTDKVGGRKWPDEVVRLAMLKTNYREPLDFTVRKLEEATSNINGWYGQIGGPRIVSEEPDPEILAILDDDLNTAAAFGLLNRLSKNAGTEGRDRDRFVASANFLGLLVPPQNFADDGSIHQKPEHANVQSAVNQRLGFIADQNWAEADRIRDELLSQGIQLKDSKDSETGERITTWEVKR